MGLYAVNRNDNAMTEVPPATFREIGARERRDLQEWIAATPGCLGEELLIIQKEFSGFDDTQERLDLLAPDKVGRLVVIENKLDDSGRDVVWQAMKYAAYCSTLTKEQTATIFRQYVDGGETAKAAIAEFLGEDDFADVAVNPNERGTGMPPPLGCWCSEA